MVGLRVIEREGLSPGTESILELLKGLELELG